MLRKIRYDLTNAQGKLTDVFRMLGEMNLQDTPAAVCDVCGVVKSGPRSLQVHMYQLHDGPEPEQWVAIEAASVEEAA